MTSKARTHTDLGLLSLERRQQVLVVDSLARVDVEQPHARKLQLRQCDVSVACVHSCVDLAYAGDTCGAQNMDVYENSAVIVER